MTKLPADLSGQDLIKALRELALRYRGIRTILHEANLTVDQLLGLL
jgi:hypothetical protein